jgi:hypothetical protein
MVHQRKQKKIKSRKIRGGFLGFDMSNAKNSLSNAKNSMSGHWNKWFSKSPPIVPQQLQQQPLQPLQQQPLQPLQQQPVVNQGNMLPPSPKPNTPKPNTPPSAKQNTPQSVHEKIQNQRLNDIGGKRRKTTRTHKSSRKKSSRKKSSRKKSSRKR